MTDSSTIALPRATKLLSGDVSDEALIANTHPADWRNPEPAPRYDLVVIGAGPGGYVAAIRAAQMGLSVALVEKEDIGGVCLNRGCIPSKALIHNAEVVSLVRRAEEFGISFENLKLDFSVAVRRSREAVERLTRGVELLLKKHNVALFYGTGSLKSVGTVAIDGEGGAKEIGAKNIILATGSRITPLPGVPVDGTGIITSDEALRLTDLPGSLLVIGGGAVGVEFAYIFSAYGVKVTIAEMEPRLLPKEDEEIGDALTRAYSKQKISVKTGCRVNGIQKEYGRYSVTLATGKKEETLPFDRILVATGRTPNSENLGLEAPGPLRHGGRNNRGRDDLRGESAANELPDDSKLYLRSTSGRERRTDRAGGERSRSSDKDREIPLQSKRKSARDRRDRGLC